MYNKVLNQVNTYYNNNRDIIFFLFFFVFYLTLGFFFMGFNDSYLRYRCDIVLYGDPGRVFHEMITKVGTHFETFAHPFFALISQSFISLIKFFVQTTRFSVIIFVSLSTTSAIFLLKKCIEKLTDNLNSALIISLIYGFSFSTLVFGTMPETYLMSSLTNLFIIYYVIHLIKSEVKELSTKNLIILIGLGFLNFGILFSNLLLDIIYFVFLLINFYSSDIKKIIFILFKVIIIFLLIGILFSFLQVFVFPSHDMFFYHNWLKGIPFVSQQKEFNFNFNLNKLLWCIKCHYFNCFYGFNLQTVFSKDHQFNMIIFAHKHSCFWKLFPALLLYVMVFLNFIKKNKNLLNNNINFLYLFIFILGFNLLTSLSFWTNECFLFGQTTLIFIMLLCGVALGSAKDNFSKWICYFLILVELIQNTRVFKNIIYPHISALNTQNSFNIFVPIIYSLITFSVFAGLIFLFKKLVNKDILNASLENKFFIALLLLLGYMVLYILFNAMFMGFEENNIAIIS